MTKYEITQYNYKNKIINTIASVSFVNRKFIRKEGTAMLAVYTSVLSFFKDIAKAGVIIAVVYALYLLYGLKKGFIIISA